MNADDIKTVTLVVNNQNARQKIDELNAKITTLKQKKDDLWKQSNGKWTDQIEKTEKELQKTEKTMARFKNTSIDVERVLDNLDKSSPNELKKTLRELQKTLNSGEVERGSKEWKKLTNAIKETSSEISKVRDEQKAASSLSDEISDWGNKWMGLAMNIQAAVDAIGGIKDVMRQATDAFAEMDDDNADVAKFTGLNSKEIEELSEALKKIDTRTTLKELKELVGESGKLGIQGTENLVNYAKAADQIKVALGDELGENATESIGKLAMMYGEDKIMGLDKAMTATASAINNVSQASSAGAGYLVQFMARVAGAANQAHISQSDLIGYAAVLDENMLMSEKSATAFQKLMIKLFQEPAMFAEMAGLNVQKFTELLKTDTNAAMLEFVNGIKNVGGMDKLAPLFDKMKLDGEGAVSVLTVLAGKINDVKKNQELANNSYREGTSVLNEFSVQNNTAKAKMDKAKNRLTDLTATLGKELMPVMQKSISLYSLSIKAILEIVTFMKIYGNEITKLVIIVVMYITIIKSQIIIDKISITLITTKNFVINRAKNMMAMLTISTKAQTLAEKELQTVQKTNIWAALLTILSLVVWKMIEYYKTTSNVKKELNGTQKALNDWKDAQKQAIESTASERKEITRLTNIIHANNITLGTRKKAIIDLKKIIPEYNAEINKEGQITRENTNAINEYIKALQKKAMQQAINDKLTKVASDQINNEMAMATWEAGLKMRQKKMNNFKIKYADIMPQLEQVEINGFMGRDRLLPKYQSKIEEKYGKKNAYKIIQEYIDNIKNLNTDETKINHYKNNIGNSKTQFTKMQTWAAKNGIELGNKEISNNDDLNLGRNQPFTSNEKNARENKSKDKSIINRIKEEEKEEIKENEIKYAKGEILYSQYQDNLFKIQENSLKKQRDLNNKESNEYYNLNNEIEKLHKDKKTIDTDNSADKIKDETKKQLQEIEKNHTLGLEEDEIYEEKVFQIKYESLKKQEELYKAINPEKSNSLRIEAIELENEQKFNKEISYAKKVEEFKKQYAQKSNEEKLKIELDFLEELNKKGLISEEQYQIAKLAIEKKYKKKSEQTAIEKSGFKEKQGVSNGGTYGNAVGNIGVDFDNIKAANEAQKKLDDLREKDLISKKEYDEAHKELEEKKWAAAIDIATQAFAVTDSLMSSTSQLFTAKQDLEVAKVTKRYDEEIKAVGSNTKKGKLLEEKKEKEIAKIKSKYAKKQMKMEMAQAAANTAVAAINAYASASKVNWLLGPIAAGLAITAGAIQMAAIAKSHQAQQAGYYVGGFTNGTNYTKEAGVVHEGEFVANHKLVNNPNLRPILNLFDKAQKNNTVGSLKASDVSRTISSFNTSTAAQDMTSAVESTISVINNEKTSEAINNLNEHLAKGITAIVEIDGRNGVARKMKEYENLHNNVSSKI